MSEFEIALLQRLDEMNISLKHLSRVSTLLEQMSFVENVVGGVEITGAKKIIKHRVLLTKDVKE